MGKRTVGTDSFRDWFFTHEEELLSVCADEAHDILLAKIDELGLTPDDVANSLAALVLCQLSWLDIAKPDEMKISEYTSRLAEIYNFREDVA